MVGLGPGCYFSILLEMFSLPLQGDHSSKNVHVPGISICAQCKPFAQKLKGLFQSFLAVVHLIILREIASYGQIPFAESPP